VREVHGSCGAGQPAFLSWSLKQTPLEAPLQMRRGIRGQFVWLKPLVSLCEECAMEKRRLRTTISGLEQPLVNEVDILYTQPSPSPLFINSKFSLCIAAHLLQLTKASSALLGTADLPKFPAAMSTHLSLN